MSLTALSRGQLARCPLTLDRNRSGALRALQPSRSGSPRVPAWRCTSTTSRPAAIGREMEVWHRSCQEMGGAAVGLRPARSPDCRSARPVTGAVGET